MSDRVEESGSVSFGDDAIRSPREALECEVLVIGSGAGGATTAAELAEAGFDVLIVEEGSWVTQGSVVPFSLDQMDRQYRSGGVTVALGVPSIAYTEGRCVGGGTEVNSGLYRRPPVEVIDHWRRGWRIEDLQYAEVEQYAERLERDLNVVRLPGLATRASQILHDGAQRLGWQSDESPRWMKYDNDDPRAGHRQSMTETYLPRSFAAGARLLPTCRIGKILFHGDRAVSAQGRMRSGREVIIRFAHVFVCAGAIQSPALLQRSGVHRNVGQSLAVHPTVKLSALFTDEVNVPDDVPVHQVKEFAPDLTFGGSASNPGLIALSLLDQWSQARDAITQWSKMAVYYAAITSEGRGRVRSLPGLPDPLVTYHLTARDRHMLANGLARLSLLMLEAGARAVFPSFRSAPIIRNQRDLAELQARFVARKASVMTVHLCSTVPMGEDRQRCAVDSYGRVHDMENVWVNDASILPDAPGVNPQGSVMVMALRNSQRFIAGRRAHG